MSEETGKGEYCDCPKKPGQVLEVDDIRDPIHSVCGKRVGPFANIAQADPASLVDAWLKHFEAMSRKAALCERMVAILRDYADNGYSGNGALSASRIVGEFEREEKK